MRPCSVWSATTIAFGVIRLRAAWQRNSSEMCVVAHTTICRAILVILWTGGVHGRCGLRFVCGHLPPKRNAPGTFCTKNKSTPYPGVWICPKHGQLLRETIFKYSGVERFQWHLPVANRLRPWTAEVLSIFNGDGAALSAFSPWATSSIPRLRTSLILPGHISVTAPMN